MGNLWPCLLLSEAVVPADLLPLGPLVSCFLLRNWNADLAHLPGGVGATGLEHYWVA